MILDCPKCGAPLDVFSESTLEAIDDGPSLRDHFALAALHTLPLLPYNDKGGRTAQRIAGECYDIADAMMEARKR